MANIAVI